MSKFNIGEIAEMNLSKMTVIIKEKKGLIKTKYRVTDKNGTDYGWKEEKDLNKK